MKRHGIGKKDLKAGSKPISWRKDVVKRESYHRKIKGENMGAKVNGQQR